MSWDKNTVSLSEVQAKVSVLKELGEPYTLTEICRVYGYGLNDYDGERYALHKLEYRDKVIIEQMQRTHDCDSDDCIVSLVVKKGEVVKPVVVLDCIDFHDGECEMERRENELYSKKGAKNV